MFSTIKNNINTKECLKFNTYLNLIGICIDIRKPSTEKRKSRQSAGLDCLHQFYYMIRKKINSNYSLLYLDGLQMLDFRAQIGSMVQFFELFFV